MIRTILAAILVLFALAAATEAVAQDDDSMGNRYQLCLNKANFDHREEFRSDCDEVCILEKKEPASCAISVGPGCCKLRHIEWNAINCALPSAEIDKENRHLKQAKERCLKQFNPNVAPPPEVNKTDR
jgi:hypothetical protein